MRKPDQFKYIRNREYYRKRLNFVLQHINLEDLRVLDLGCGECLFSECSEFKKIKSYTAVDELEYKTRIPYIRENVVDFLKTDKASYDLILCLGLVDHLEDSSYRELLTEISKRSSSGWVISMASSQNPIIGLFHSAERTVLMHNYMRKPELEIKLLKIPFSSKIMDLSHWPGFLSTETLWIRYPKMIQPHRN
jgi:hypothetical protein